MRPIVVAAAAAGVAHGLRYPLAAVIGLRRREDTAAVIRSVATNDNLVLLLLACKRIIDRYAGEPADAVNVPAGFSMRDALGCAAVAEAWALQERITPERAAAIAARTLNSKRIRSCPYATSALLPWPLVLRSPAVWLAVAPSISAYSPAGAIYPEAAGSWPLDQQWAELRSRVLVNPRLAGSRSAACAAGLSASLSRGILYPVDGMLRDQRASPFQRMHSGGAPPVSLNAGVQSAEALESIFPLYRSTASDDGGMGGGPDSPMGSVDSVHEAVRRAESSLGRTSTEPPSPRFQSPHGTLHTYRTTHHAGAMLRALELLPAELAILATVWSIVDGGPAHEHISPLLRIATGQVPSLPSQWADALMEMSRASVGMAATAGDVRPHVSAFLAAYSTLEAFSTLSFPNGALQRTQMARDALYARRKSEESARSVGATTAPQSHRTHRDVSDESSTAANEHAQRLANAMDGRTGQSWENRTLNSESVGRSRPGSPFAHSPLADVASHFNRGSLRLTVRRPSLRDHSAPLTVYARAHCLMIDPRRSSGPQRLFDRAFAAFVHLGSLSESPASAQPEPLSDRTPGPETSDEETAASAKARRIVARHIGTSSGVWMADIGPEKITFGNVVAAHEATWDGSLLLVGLRLLDEAWRSIDAAPSFSFAYANVHDVHQSLSLIDCAALGIASAYFRKHKASSVPAYIAEEVFGETGGRLMRRALAYPCPDHGVASATIVGTAALALSALHPSLMTGACADALACVAAFRRARVHAHEAEAPYEQLASGETVVYESMAAALEAWAAMPPDTSPTALLPSVAVVYNGEDVIHVPNVAQMAVLAAAAAFVHCPFFEPLPGEVPPEVDTGSRPYVFVAPQYAEAAVDDVRNVIAPALGRTIAHNLLVAGHPGIRVPAAMWRTLYAVADVISAHEANRSDRGTAADDAVDVCIARMTWRLRTTPSPDAENRAWSAHALAAIGSALHEIGVTRAFPLRAMLFLAGEHAGRWAGPLGYNGQRGDGSDEPSFDMAWVLSSAAFFP